MNKLSTAIIGLVSKFTSLQKIDPRHNTKTFIHKTTSNATDPTKKINNSNFFVLSRCKVISFFHILPLMRYTNTEGYLLLLHYTNFF